MRALALALPAWALAGCTFLQEPALAPSVAPTPPPRPAAASAATQEHARLSTYFQQRQDARRARGLLRLDGQTAPLPDDPARVTDIYVEVALRDEYQFRAGRALPSGAPAALRRWERPVAYRLTFGDSVPAATRQSDREEVARVVALLSDATRHPVRLLPETRVTGGNFHVLVLNAEERRQAAPRLRALVPGIDDTTVGLITALPLSAYCLVVAFSRSNDGSYTDAIAVVRAELPDLTRLACYHEEMAQGLGLVNDSDIAVPSIFNDSQAFARLTALDLMLLRIHYDARLRPGMRETQARPIVQRIVNDLMIGES